MKNADIFSDLGKLSLKYSNIGLTIDFEFNRFGIILKGWLDRTLNTVDVYEYNREYSYQFINSLSDSIDIEEIVDEFKNEIWESYVKEQTISNLKKLKSFHNGSYGADINRAIKALEQKDAIKKIRAEVESINPWTLAFAPAKDRDIRPQIVTNVKNHVLEIIDKYREEKLNHRKGEG